MGNSSTEAGGMTIGVDLGDQCSQVCVLDPGGVVVEQGRIRTTAEALKGRFGTMPRARIALEAGTHSAWVSRLLQECGHQVIVANPRKLRLIYENDNKDDRVDAEYLARVARMDATLLAPIQHRGAEAQRDLTVLRSRDALVQSRTKLINHVRGTVKGVGGRIRKMSTEAFGTKGEATLPDQTRGALAPVMEVIRTLTQQIRKYDGWAEKTVEERYPCTAVLQQVPGVGALTALAYVLTLEDPKRFADSRQVGAFLGLRPRRAQSGESDPQLRITKAGDGLLRRLLVGSAHYILGPFGPDTDLRRWGLKLAGRGGINAKKRAIVAVARKLAVLLHRLWVTQEPYEPVRQGKRKAEAREVESVGRPVGVAPGSTASAGGGPRVESKSSV